MDEETSDENKTVTSPDRQHWWSQTTDWTFHGMSINCFIIICSIASPIAECKEPPILFVYFGCIKVVVTSTGWIDTKFGFAVGLSYFVKRYISKCFDLIECFIAIK